VGGERVASPMAGRVCIVTGASSGIGKETAAGLTRLGATVVLACRNPRKGEAVRQEILTQTGDGEVERAALDLASLRSVRAFAADAIARHPRTHVLVNNAGIFSRSRRVTEDGLESQFQVNYLGPFLLTHLLLPALEAGAPSRIVNVSSAAHTGGRIDFADLQGEREYSGFRAYNQSKLAQVLFTRELARRLEGTRVTANALHPGVIRTNLGRGEFPRAFDLLVRPFMKSPMKGARTPIFVASSPALDGVSGRYFAKMREVASSPASQDAAAARRLWDLSLRMAGLEP